jgi:hypothetical protein
MTESDRVVNSYFVERGTFRNVCSGRECVFECPKCGVGKAGGGDAVCGIRSMGGTRMRDNV